MIGEAPNLIPCSLPSLSFFLLPLSSAVSIPRPSCHPCLSRNGRFPFLSLRHSKIETASPRRSNHWSFFFYGSFFPPAFNSLLQDSLDSLGDYVSCYYSSREEHPRIPPPTSASSVPSTPSMLLLFFGYRFIDLLGESPTRDKTSTVSITYFYKDENLFICGMRIFIKCAQITLTLPNASNVIKNFDQEIFCDGNMQQYVFFLVTHELNNYKNFPQKIVFTKNFYNHLIYVILKNKYAVA